MDIIFYKLQDEVNDVKKTRTLTATQSYTPITVTGTLKSATSKVAPSIEFSKPIDYFNDYNYCYIADFKRYYFVVDMVSSRNDYTIIDLRVDVLTSFLTQSNMGNLEGFVGRCSNSSLYKNTIPDTRVQFKSDKYVEIVEPTSVTGNIENLHFSLHASNNILISTTAVGYYLPNAYPLQDIAVPSELMFLTNTLSIDKDFFKPEGNYYLYVTDTDDEQIIRAEPLQVLPRPFIFLSHCASKDDMQSFVNNVIVYPFTIPNTGTRSEVIILDKKVPITPSSVANLELYSATRCNSGYLVLKDFILSQDNISHYHNDFTKYEPYTSCEIFIPFVSWISIDIKKNIDCRLMVIYNVDYTSGQATVFIINKTRNEVIFQTNAKVGVEVPVNTTNLKENELKDQNYTRNFLTGLLSSTIVGAVGGVSLNPYLVTAGVTGVISSTVSYINNENLLIDRGSGQTVPPTTTSAMLSGLKVLVRWTKVVSTNFDTQNDRNSFIKRFGIPTNTLTNLGSIPVSGEYHTYAEITDIHTTSKTGLYSITDITYREIDELKALCSNGIYL